MQRKKPRTEAKLEEIRQLVAAATEGRNRSEDLVQYESPAPIATVSTHHNNTPSDVLTHPSQMMYGITFPLIQPPTPQFPQWSTGMHHPGFHWPNANYYPLSARQLGPHHLSNQHNSPPHVVINNYNTYNVDASTSNTNNYYNNAPISTHQTSINTHGQSQFKSVHSTNSESARLNRASGSINGATSGVFNDNDNDDKQPDEAEREDVDETHEFTADAPEGMGTALCEAYGGNASGCNTVGGEAARADTVDAQAEREAIEESARLNGASGVSDRVTNDNDDKQPDEAEREDVDETREYSAEDTEGMGTVLCEVTEGNAPGCNAVGSEAAHAETVDAQSEREVIELSDDEDSITLQRGTVHEETWTCKRCTLINTSSASLCAVCFKSKDELCPICREFITNDLIITTCAHKFHERCLRRWTWRNNVCPCCFTREPLQYRKHQCQI